ncbi:MULTISPECIES: hybrid sensor histidine kinase/response regulator [Deefgea]|uniref:histidine kinase n=1 Tax=Deefgea chitinilytica TaxID=570276 RepID=A0ABS2CCZ9_9NEIS|nr:MULTISPECIES: ATP-binding protein [Deefgea]MBM5572024.1 response regulator [Deefgea chitinilytica]MBM9889259.1 response regulator [Deefgea sp. CFH1-16]
MTRFRIIFAAICIILLSNFSVMVHFEFKQKKALNYASETGIDNQLWQFFQLNNEYQRLREVVQHGNPTELEPILLRFDIFYSRIHSFAVGEIEAAPLFQHPNLTKPIMAPLIRYIHESAKILEKNPISSEDWQKFKQATIALEPQVNLLIQEARTHDANEIDENRKDIRHWGELRVILATLQMLLLFISAALGLYALWRSEKSRQTLADTAISLQEARQQAEVANEAKSRFLAHISHEIRTPLTSILGYTDRLSRKPLGPEERREVSHIAKSGAHLLRLLNNVLDLSKADQNKLCLVNETLNFKQFKQELETMFEMMAQAKAIDFSIHLAAELPDNVILDAGKFRQIMINLISNSLKFTQAGKVSVIFYAEAHTNYYQIYATVCDTGCGIKAQDQARIFSPFEQGESGQLAGGTGLGLALSRDYARLMHGDIQFTSQEHIGSEFIVNVQAQSAPELADSTTKTNSDHIAHPKSLSNQLILVVEDQAINREMICEILHDFGAKTLEAANGLEGIAQAQHNPEITAIIMDYQMPEMNGMDAAVRLRENGWNQPIYLVSASPLSELQTKPEFRAFTGHLHKPFTIDEIVALLNPDAKTPAPSPISESQLILNAENAMQRLGFSAERFWPLCQKGLLRIEELEEKFTQAYSEGHQEDAIRHAHSAKGIALQIGAELLAERWAQLESSPDALPVAQLRELRQATQQALATQSV